MKNSEEKRKEASNKKPVTAKKPIPAKEEEKVFNPISEESLAERQLLDEMFSAGADAQAESDKRKRKVRQATIVLLDGRETSLEQLHARFVATPRPYRALFPNDDDFFPHALRIHGFAHLDPKIYPKPRCMRDFILRVIYGRFFESKRLLRAIEEVNPIGPNGYRLYKLYQHVDEKGEKEIEGFRDDATEIMKRCTTDYECNQKLHSEYGVPFQTDAFKQ